MKLFEFIFRTNYFAIYEILRKKNTPYLRTFKGSNQN